MHNERNLFAPLIGVVWAIGVIVAIVLVGTLFGIAREILLLFGRLFWGPGFGESSRRKP